jgi:zinc transport system substrate-binding protein
LALRIRIILIRRIVVAGLAAVPLLGGAAACRAPRTFADDGRLHVVAGFFPLAEAARRVGGDRVRVVDLTPPGVEPHDLELSTKQVDQVQDADVVILLGGGFQPALGRAAKRAKGKVVRIDPPTADPHIWLDPVRMADIVDRVAAAIPGAVAGPFKGELAAIDRQFRTGLAQCRRHDLVTSHEAFGYLSQRYGLTPRSVAGLSPDAEPDPRRLAEVADLIRRTHATTVFTEELVSPKVGRALARETGAVTDVLNPLESGHPGDYTKAMRGNLQRLRRALSCL